MITWFLDSGFSSRFLVGLKEKRDFFEKNYLILRFSGYFANFAHFQSISGFFVISRTTHQLTYVHFFLQPVQLLSGSVRKPLIHVLLLSEGAAGRAKPQAEPSRKPSRAKGRAETQAEPSCGSR